MTEWTHYTGSPEQIAEMMKSQNGYIVKDGDDRESDIIYYRLTPLKLATFTHYLLCNPHPLADMIIRQARTGQPVWVKLSTPTKFILQDFPTTKPDWNIPGAEYSFTPFEDQIVNDGLSMTIHDPVTGIPTVKQIQNDTLELRSKSGRGKP